FLADTQDVADGELGPRPVPDSSTHHAGHTTITARSLSPMLLFWLFMAVVFVAAPAGLTYVTCRAFGVRNGGVKFLVFALIAFVNWQMWQAPKKIGPEPLDDLARVHRKIMSDMDNARLR